MKRVIIAHGWEGTPEEGWFPWLKKELEERDFQVIIPQLPDTKSPRIQKWVPALADAIGFIDEDTYLIGHSMGCQTIVRFLESFHDGQKVGGVVFVAGFFNRLTDIDDDENSRETESEWLGTPIDFEKVRKQISKSIAIFSDNDPYVPMDNQDDFRDKLGSEIIIEHSMGHFNESYGCFKLPIVLESVLKLVRN